MQTQTYFEFKYSNGKHWRYVSIGCCFPTVAAIGKQVRLLGDEMKSVTIKHIDNRDNHTLVCYVSEPFDLDGNEFTETYLKEHGWQEFIPIHAID